jgi:hypothetical protein
MADYEPTREEVRALIAVLFSDAQRFSSNISNMRWVQTEDVTAVEFAIYNSEIGKVDCLYILEPMAYQALKSNQGSQVHAESALATKLDKLYISFAIALDNAADSAKVAIKESIETSGGLSKKRKPSSKRERNRQHKDALERMNARNYLLINPPTTGGRSALKLEELAGAVGLLLSEGKTKGDITVGQLALKVRRSGKAVYTLLTDNGFSIDSFLNQILPD